MYVLFGQAGAFPAAFNLTTLNGANGFKVEGLNGGDYLGYSVSTVGDLNGDGKADLVLGAWRASPGGRGLAGTVYVLFGQANAFPAAFNLTTLNGANGFKVEGLNGSDYLGYSVSTAGDLNGDGKADLVLGAYGVSPGGASKRSEAGTVYVLFGQAATFPAVFDLTSLNGSNGFKVEGLNTSDFLGWSVSTAGDLNGDGKADLVIGNPGTAVNSFKRGRAYVLFGQAGGWPASFDLTTLNGANGFKVEYLAFSGSLGHSVSTAGDLNGDGKADLVLGDPGAAASVDGLPHGTAYVLFGQASPFPASFNLTTLNGANGFKVEGLSVYDGLGVSVSTAGDLNGDGKADLVLGANGANSYTGIAYVLFGQASPFPASFDLTTLNGTNGFKVEGLNSGDHLGSPVGTAGDLNGDGKAELVLGTWQASPGGRSGAGTVYVIFGSDGTLVAPTSLSIPAPMTTPSFSTSQAPSPILLLSSSSLQSSTPVSNVVEVSSANTLGISAGVGGAMLLGSFTFG